MRWSISWQPHTFMVKRDAGERHACQEAPFYIYIKLTLLKVLSTYFSRCFFNARKEINKNEKIIYQSAYARQNK